MIFCQKVLENLDRKKHASNDPSAQVIRPPATLLLLRVYKWSAGSFET